METKTQGYALGYHISPFQGGDAFPFTMNGMSC